MWDIKVEAIIKKRNWVIRYAALTPVGITQAWQLEEVAVVVLLEVHFAHTHHCCSVLHSH